MAEGGKGYGDIAAELLVMGAIGLVLGLLGPFGTFPLPAAQRIATWIGFAFAGYACFRPVIAAAHRLMERAAVPASVAYALACALASLPMALVVAWTFPQPGPIGERAAAVYPYVLLLGGLATAIQRLLFLRRSGTDVAAPPPTPLAAAPSPSDPPVAEPPPAQLAFLDRLPPALGRELLCLEMEDHYVRAHTARGSALLLMRMRDAVAELAGLQGARVHRSWWVARDAVVGTTRRDRAVALRLANGLEVPVARTAVPELRAAGWL